MYTAAGSLDKQHYVEQFSPLVKRIAHQMMVKLPPSVQLGDIMQAGLIGLMDAVGRYEVEQGVQFETYAAQRIRGAMLDELRQNDWMPRSARKTQRQLDAAIARLEQRLGRPPNEREIAKELGVDMEEYGQLVRDAHGQRMLFYDDMADDEGNSDFLDRNLASAGDDPLQQLADERFREALIGAIGNLPEREKLLMGLYYEQELNFKEIAAVLGVTESRVCQLHGQAVARLRTKLHDW
ncbi:MAG: RNA polymerase sigma factor FliA [Burkholderiales bacterium]